MALLAPPVLHVLFAHGVVLEPHLQNVLAGVDRDGWPTQVFLRDLEGVKLVSGSHEALLASLPPRVARGLAYDRRAGLEPGRLLPVRQPPGRGGGGPGRPQPGPGGRPRSRVCGTARRQLLTGFARDHGWTPELRGLLAGVPLPAKANLTVRWARAGDRDAPYVPVRNPLDRPRLTGP